MENKDQKMIDNNQLDHLSIADLYSIIKYCYEIVDNSSDDDLDDYELYADKAGIVLENRIKDIFKE